MCDESTKHPVDVTTVLQVGRINVLLILKPEDHVVLTAGTPHG